VTNHHSLAPNLIMNKVKQLLSPIAVKGKGIDHPTTGNEGSERGRSIALVFL